MKLNSLFILLSFIVLSIQTKAQENTGKYFQEIRTDISLPYEAGKNVIKLFSLNKIPIAITSNGIYKFNSGKWSGSSFTPKISCAAIDSKNVVWLATANTIRNEEGSIKYSLPESAKNDTVLCLLWENEKTLYVGTSNGLFLFNGNWMEVPAAKGKRINSIVLDEKQNLWLATNDGLIKRTGEEWINLDDVLMANGLKRVYYSLCKAQNDKDLLFGGLLTVGCIAENGRHWMWSGADGLPYGPITSIVLHNKTLWLGTPKGIIKKDENWRYYLGKRWLPDDKINDILPLDERTVWIGTPNGISQIQEVEMSFEKKAAVYEDIIQKRHNRLGIVNVAHLSVPGDLSTSKTKNEDNDGLWTSTYLAAECFRFAVTKDIQAKENAIRTYEVLERLETVTGISGLPARSYALAIDSVEQSRSPHPKKWRSSPDGKWQWLDDTSSDEIVGHMFAISVFYDLVADDEFKNRARDLVGRILDHIIDNDFHLIDYDGLPTRWGVWHPDSINHSKNWAYEKGLYSLEILSFLKTAVHITGNPKFEKTYRMLIEKHNYAENTVLAKIFGPFENSHSDDILTYFSYYPLFQYSADDKYLPLYKKSLERTWTISRPEKISAWNIITSVLLEKNCDLDVATEELRQYPTDLIDWSMQNSHRWDLIKDPIVDRGGNLQATKPVPSAESGIYRWNTNPRKLDTGTGGKREETGTYFLLPYWMGRYHKLLTE